MSRMGKLGKQLSVARLGRLVGGERAAHLDLSTQQIVGHLQVTGRNLWAWYALGGVPWAFTSEAQRLQVWDQLANRLAGLAGHAIKLRTTSRPFPAFAFARDLDADTPTPLPDVDDAHSFDAYLAGQQRRLHTALLDEKVVVLGIQVGPAPGKGVLSSLADSTARPVGEAGKLLDRLRELNAHMAGAGLDGRPLSAKQMAWLMHRSVGIGMPVSLHAGVAGQVWERDDLYAFTDPVEWISSPLGETVRVDGLVNGQRISRHVAVLSMGRMPDRLFPEDGRDPWMLAADKLPFPVDWCLSGVLIKPKELESAVKFEQDRAINIDRHYREEHGLEPPPAVARAIAQARDTYDQVTDGDGRSAVRFAGPIRMAVYAETREECMERARTLIDFYGERHSIEVVHAKGQRETLREFIPGEPWSVTGYQRRMPVGYLAASLPHVSSAVGTPTGPYIGYTVGTARRAVLHDAHFPMEKLNTPGLVPIVAEPGGGKSFAIGLLAYHAARRGQPTAILDPSGPLARLCDLPELAGSSRLFNLTNADPGTLSPPQLIPEPQRHEYPTEQEHVRAVRRAAAERQQLLFDTCRMLMPSSALADARTDRGLRNAVRAVGGSVTANPHRVMTVLRASGDEHDTELARLLEDAAEFPLGELIFPTDDADLSLERSEDKTLLVITMPGLVTPDPSLERQQWSTEELYTLPLLHLAAFFTSRFIYARPMNQRKNIFLDENHFMGSWGSGRALFVRLSRDSRKWDTAVYAASQHPDDVLGVGKVEALIGGALVGRLEDEDTAKRAVRQLLRAPEEYAPAVMRLSPRPAPGEPLDRARVGEFIYRDAYGRPATIRFDADWHPELRAALQTTPGQSRIPDRTPASGDEFVNEASLFAPGDAPGGPRTDRRAAA